MHDFQDSNGETYANIDQLDNNQFEIYRQYFNSVFLGSTKDIEVLGEGVLSDDGGTLTIEYRLWNVDDATWYDQCTAVYTID